MGQQVDALVAQFNGIIFFIDDNIEGIVDDMHILGLLGEVEVFSLQHQRLHARFAEKFDQCLVLWQPVVRPQQLLAGLFQVFIVFWIFRERFCL